MQQSAYADVGPGRASHRGHTWGHLTSISCSSHCAFDLLLKHLAADVDQLCRGQGGRILSSTPVGHSVDATPALTNSNAMLGSVDKGGGQGAQPAGAARRRTPGRGQRRPQRARLEEITEEGDLANDAVYSLFGSRNGLLIPMLTDSLGPHYEGMQEPIPADLDLVEAVDTFARYYRRLCDD